MSRKLTIRELAPYLPCGLEMLSEDKIHVLTVATFSYRLLDSKPILHPLSDLQTRHARNCGYITIDAFIEAILLRKIEIRYWEDLVSNHYDVNSLIEANLAIDINTIEK